MNQREEPARAAAGSAAPPSRLPATLRLGATGRGISYHGETLEEAYESRATYGAPDFEVEGWVTSYRAIAAGEMDAVSDTVARLTGRAPTTLADFLRRHPEGYRHLLGS